MMTKSNQAIQWLQRNCDKLHSNYNDLQITATYMQRKLRMSVRDNGVVLEVGDDDFDRWANSVAHRQVIDTSMPIYPQIFTAIRTAMEY
jgi:hypothetical protein